MVSCELGGALGEDAKMAMVMLRIVTLKDVPVFRLLASVD